MTENKYEINDDWGVEYQDLENIRKSGITNMWGAAPYLAKRAGISQELATKILLNWMHNYNELAKKYNW
jgi:hypothetical protein